jgi:branched-chain amino acid transport system ATP-binding protein
MNAVTPALEARGLVKHFGGIAATQEVTLVLPPGARHALIGPNGAGKTTLVNLLTGVLAPSSGRICLGGEDVTHLPVHRRVQKGLVRTFQISQLFETMTPLQTLAFAVQQAQAGSWNAWTPLGQDTTVLARADHLLEQFHLSSLAGRTVRELPYGKRRLLEIAIALATSARVLLLDEPMAGVPAHERSELLSILGALPPEVAVLLIEHDMDLVFSFARRMTVLVNGAVLTEGSPADIAADARVQAVYLGTEPVQAGAR